MVEKGHAAGDSALKKLLDSRILPEGKTGKPVSGLLYFPMEKQKMKDLELHYGGRENRISLRFNRSAAGLRLSARAARAGVPALR